MGDSNAYFLPSNMGKSFRDCVNTVGHYGASFFIAQTMSSRRNRKHLFYGSVQTAVKIAWDEYDGNILDDHDKSELRRLLGLNGYKWVGTQEAPRWEVPDAPPFPWRGETFRGESSTQHRIVVPKPPSADTAYLCPSCKQTFPSRESLDTHDVDVHGANKREALLVAKRQLSEDERAARVSSLVAARQRLNDPWTCPECGYAGTKRSEPGHMSLHKLSRSNESVLYAIAADPGYRNDHYAAILGISSPAMSVHVKRLRKFGMVQSRGTRKTQEVWLTAAGEDYVTAREGKLVHKEIPEGPKLSKAALRAAESAEPIDTLPDWADDEPRGMSIGQFMAGESEPEPTVVVTVPEPEIVVIDDAEDIDEPATASDTKVRFILTVDKGTRHKVRIAAALADKEVSEWAEEVLSRAARKVTDS